MPTFFAVNEQNLIRKFQIAHFVTAKNLALRTYPQLLHFLESAMELKVGKLYQTEMMGQEMLSYLAKAVREEDVQNAFNNGEMLYYTLLIDGSLYNVEKVEVVVLKRVKDGSPHHVLLGMEYPTTTNAEGIAGAVNKACEK
jgi:hypothetical protein